jgi:hypothetical protein
MLQSVAADMAISTRFVANSIKDAAAVPVRFIIYNMNNGGCNEVHQSTWHIVAEIPAACTHSVPRQPDEAAADEPTTDRNERFRVQVFNMCIESVIALSERFAEDKIPLRYRCNLLLRGN